MGAEFQFWEMERGLWMGYGDETHNDTNVLIAGGLHSQNWLR